MQLPTDAAKTFRLTTTMDTITHIAAGACIGEVFFGKQLGKRAMLLGAIANSIPDIDFVASLWMSTAPGLLAHRGFTHSFFFAAVITPFLALIAEKWHRPHNISLKRWMIFFAVQLFLHLFLDAFNNYGVGWFEPFSRYRVSFNTLYVADPFFSLWLGVAFVVLLILKSKSKKRLFWVRFGLGISATYLLYCVINKFKIDSDVEKALARQQIAYKEYITTPTPLNNWLWYIVVANDSGYNIGFRSLFDKKNEIEFEYFPRNDSLLNPVHDHEDVQYLLRFSQGYYTVENWNDTLVFNDLRFGQIIGWQEPREQFVFHYFLQHPNDNKLVVQRGRFAKWDGDVVRNLLKRIVGN